MLLGPDRADGVLVGSGRFADATGSFTMVRYFNFATEETNGTIEGKISPPGARHR